MNKKHLVLFSLALLLSAPVTIAQTAKDKAKLEEKLKDYFRKYKPKGTRLRQAPRMLEYHINDTTRQITITADEFFAAQEFTPEITERIYKKVHGKLPKAYRDYQVTIFTNGMTIDELIPNRLSDNADKSRLWGDIEYSGQPWVKNVSSPVKLTHGLQGRHISLWASHGRFYDQQKGYWRWQRPKLFGTTEDLYTQTIVVPYLIPMLENSGAIVFTPRERDWQKEEVIVDNDGPKRNYIEVTSGKSWITTSYPGFAYHTGFYHDQENPFEAGTCRMATTTSSKSRYSLATYQPDFRKSGRYAVYVSYQSLPSSIDDAQYTVWHRGERTVFHVNQRMGGGTWVYLGTFDFDAGYSEFNRVTVSNQSEHRGIVTTDAVRFGGGMGNIERFGSVSGFPRALEGARYYAQWAGMPYSVYSSKNGADDYADDINVRSHMTNLLGGGSCYMPTIEGLKVPIELSLAIHSDAGYARDGEGIIGPLSICTTNSNDGKLNAGISRMASRDFADALLNNEQLDIKYKYGQWHRRELFDRNYSETRLPEVPSAILEILSHQNFPDMRYGQDPNFRFTLARSIYKTILRYINDQHGRPFIVAPLAPDHFRIEFKDDNNVRLSWEAVNDPQEPTARPTSYVLYTAIGDASFDNGQYIKAINNIDIELEPYQLYHFKVAAVNRGGQSFTTEVLSAYYNPKATKTVLIVNGFHRLSSPAIRNNPDEQGFDIDEDPGITRGPTYGWSGRQLNFNRKEMGVEGGGLGYSGEELAGMLLAGNDFNYVKTHADAIAYSRSYNIVSCSSEALERNYPLKDINAIDMVLGLEYNDGHSLKPYKTFTSHTQNVLRSFTSRGGALFVSGAYIGRDLLSDSDRQFLSSTLKCQYNGRNMLSSGILNGLGTTMQYYNTLNEEHYATTSTERLSPVGSAYSAMLYDNGYSAAVAYSGNDYRAFTMAVPFECIKDAKMRSYIMHGILNYLIK